MRKPPKAAVPESLAARGPGDSFASTAALVVAVEPPETWNYAWFRKCRTFDEVKTLAASMNLKARNESGRIELFRKTRLVGSFWLFD